MKPKSASVRMQKCLRCNFTGPKTPSKTANFSKLSDNPLTIRLLTQNYLKRCISRYFRPRKILSEICQFFSTYFVKLSDNESVFPICYEVSVHSTLFLRKRGYLSSSEKEFSLSCRCIISCFYINLFPS